jgi:hypothetical protein
MAAAVEGGFECALVHQFTACEVDEERAWPHPGEGFRAEHVPNMCRTCARQLRGRLGEENAKTGPHASNP